MSMTLTLPDSIRGYVNFSEKPGESPLCGAGLYKGQIVNDSLFLSFTSNDTDNNCGYDRGWLFTLKGRFYANKDSIAGMYVISNSTNESGFFNIKRPGTTAISTLDTLQPCFMPNPANGKFRVKLLQYVTGASILITNQLGGKVFSKQLTSDMIDVDLDVPDGVYFLSIISSGLQSTQTLVIRH
jgi:hypothetical protein